MPLVKTLNSSSLENTNTLSQREVVAANELVSKITFDLLKESPQLIADVENGLINRKALEVAIIRNIDKNKYYVGISSDKLIQKVFNYMFGYWDLEKYIKDESISDIDGTRYDYFTICRNGKRSVIPFKFASPAQFENFCKLIAIRNGGILNENDAHCRVSDEANRLRINISIRPRNISGPAINIRKHRQKSYTLEDLERIGMFNSKLMTFFRKIAKSDLNMIFCGKGGAGKTTLLRAIVNNFPLQERVLVCETDTEIYPDNPDFIVQRIKKANEGGRPVTLRDLVRDGLTMSLDTYIVGEIVGDEAWELVKAGFTGHRVLATIHSRSAKEVFFRLITLIKTAGVDHSEKVLNRMLAESLDIVVHLKDFLVNEVLKVHGYDEKSDRFETETIFRREDTSV